MKAIIAILVLFSCSRVYGGSATWLENPTGPNWTKSRNWNPRTIPDGPDDVASFGASSVTTVTLPLIYDDLTVGGIVFLPDAPSYTITMAGYPGGLSISGAGVTNSSQSTQYFLNRDNTNIYLRGSAVAGNGTIFVNPGSDIANNVFGSWTTFFDNASADHATFVNRGGYIHGGYLYKPGKTSFQDNSTAAYATFQNTQLGTANFSGNSNAGNATFINDDIAVVAFEETTTAAQATFTNNANEKGKGGGSIVFSDSADAGASLITNNASVLNAEGFALTAFYNSASAADAVITNNGSGVVGGVGAFTQFSDGSTAGSSTLQAYGGTADGAGGGSISFLKESLGGEARVELFGNGTLQIGSHSAPGVTVGSVEGDGQIQLGSRRLVVGSSARDTLFSGVIGGSGALDKVGDGTLILSGANSYSGGTTVESGSLLLDSTSGSASGAGPVEVDGGIFGGRGEVRDSVTIGSGSGTGGYLAPGIGGAGTLAIHGAVTFRADGNYECDISLAKKRADKVICTGVAIEDGAQFLLQVDGDQSLTAGTIFSVIVNDADTAIEGAFSNLPDGGTITAGPNTLRVSYAGGDGNDLTLTVLP